MKMMNQEEFQRFIKGQLPEKEFHATLDLYIRDQITDNDHRYDNTISRSIMEQLGDVDLPEEKFEILASIIYTHANRATNLTAQISGIYGALTVVKKSHVMSDYDLYHVASIAMYRLYQTSNEYRGYCALTQKEEREITQ